MKTLIRNFFFIQTIVAILCTNNFAYAQSKTGTTIGQVLLIEPSARTTGMGNAGVALYDEVASAFYNPGALGQLSGYGVHFTHSLWLADLTYDYAAAFLQAGSFGNLFFSLTALNSGEIPVRTVTQPLGTGERYTVSHLALGLGYGRVLSEWSFLNAFSVRGSYQNIFLQDSEVGLTLDRACHTISMVSGFASITTGPVTAGWRIRNGLGLTF